ncbi:MAG TPA: alpha-E domain-containing protein [Tepidisphaeraceae bacterium]|nr:alpha-E domain-containing protein [Tepidisphaeraceae bacterium]
MNNEPIPIDAAAIESPLAGPVLARDADASYWMARYVERAEHVARLLLVNSEALIDVGDVAAPLLQQHWQSVLQIMNVESIPDGDDPYSLRITEELTFNTNSPNSLISCLTRARENARGIREVISSEMWEHLNLLYWTIRSTETRTAFEESPDQLYRQIINGSMLFQGLTDQTLIHGQRWHFTQLGKYFERISVTCRILQAKYELLHGADVSADTPLSNLHWTTLLSSCGSIEAFRRTYSGETDPLHVAQFLVLEKDFPRCIRYCAHQAYEAITAIRGIVRPHSVDPTERILGRLDSQLEYAQPSELLEHGLPNYVGQIMENIAQAGISVLRSFFLH